MDKYIRYYDNLATPEFCEQLIGKFEKHSEHYDLVETENFRSFNQINFLNHDEWKEEVNPLMEIFHNGLAKYIGDCGIIREQFPNDYGFEAIRMKRYMPNDKDQFSDHVDVGDLDSSRRFLTFFLYLNNNEAGETEFPQHNIKIKPVTGRLIIFPPMWNYWHAGRKPINTNKYIVGSYLHYIN